MDEVTEHTVKIEKTPEAHGHEKLAEGDELTVQSLAGETSLAPDGEHTTDDAEEAAWVAERAMIAGANPTVETIYADGEPAATSIHTGSRPALEQATAKTSKSKASTAKE